jgi:hypothetical protein
MSSVQPRFLAWEATRLAAAASVRSNRANSCTRVALLDRRDFRNLPVRCRKANLESD